MKLLANGDSNTYGHGLSDTGTASADWPCGPNRDCDSAWVKKNCAYALQNSWPRLVSTAVGYDCVNISRPGGSNDRIVRTTLQYLSKHGYSNTLVIIGWSHPDRREVHVEDELTTLYNEYSGYKSFWNCGHDRFSSSKGEKWANNYYRYGWDDIESHVRFYSQVMLMAAYLKQRNIPYLFFNVMYNPTQWQSEQEINKNSYALHMTSSLHSAIDWSSFVSNGESMIDQITDLDETRHWTQQGHIAFSELLVNELKTRGQLP